MPQLVDALDALAAEPEVHIHLSRLGYVDHACMEAISAWKTKREAKKLTSVVSWDALMDRYNGKDRERSASARDSGVGPEQEAA